MKKFCYILKNCFDHVGDPGYDAECLSVRGDEDEIGPDMMDIDDFDVPEQLFYLADFDNIPEYDYPATIGSTTIMSNKMLDILVDKGISKYLKIPVIMIDHCYLDELFDNNGILRSEVPVNHDYVAIQIKEYTEALDLSASDYDEDHIFGKPVGFIRKFVLREPKGGFPSLFRIKEDFSVLFITQEAKEALKLAGIKGCRFERIQVSE